MSDRVALGLTALAIAMQLKSGRFDREEMQRLRLRAERLPVDDILVLTIDAATAPLQSARPADWAAIGRALHDRLDVAMRPVPADLGRADIYG